MTENNKPYLVGRVKLVIAREFPDQDWTIITLRKWVDSFDYGYNCGIQEEYLREIFSMCVGDLQQDFKTEVIKLKKNEKSVGVFELIAEVHSESWKSWTNWGYEYDAREWLENVEIQELKGEALQWFKEEQAEAWADYWGEEVDDGIL